MWFRTLLLLLGSVAMLQTGVFSDETEFEPYPEEEEVRDELHGVIVMEYAGEEGLDHFWILQPPDHSTTANKLYTLTLLFHHMNITQGTEIDLPVIVEDGVTEDATRCPDYVSVCNKKSIQKICGEIGPDDEPYEMTVEHVNLFVRVNVHVTDCQFEESFNATYNWSEEGN